MTVCTVLCLGTGIAAAQQLTPPKDSGSPEPPIVTTWLVIALATGAVVVATVLPSKRGHQD